MAGSVDKVQFKHPDQDRSTPAIGDKHETLVIEIPGRQTEATNRKRKRSGKRQGGTPTHPGGVEQPVRQVRREQRSVGDGPNTLQPEHNQSGNTKDTTQPDKTEQSQAQNTSSEATKKDRRKRHGKKKKGKGNADSAGNSQVQSDQSKQNEVEKTKSQQPDKQETSAGPSNKESNVEELIRQLEKDYVYQLKEKSSKFPQANYRCKVCDYHCDNIAVCQRHIKDKKHKRMVQAWEEDQLLRNIPPPSSTHLEALDTLLMSAVGQYALTADQVKERQDIVDRVNETVRKSVQDCQFHLFGSSANGFGLKDSNVNIDISIPKGLQTSKILLQVLEILETCDDYNKVESKFSEKIPAIHFTDQKSGLNCVLTYSETDASRQTSRLLGTYSQIDPRVKELGVALRYWGRLCHIDKQNEGSLPAHSFPIMVIYFLQQCQPPVLPILHGLLREGETERDKLVSKDTVCSYYDDLEKLPSVWKCENTSRVGELWIQMLKFYTLEFKMTELVVCIRQSAPFDKETKKWGTKKIAIEDPYMLKRNLARSVNSQLVFEYFLDRLRDGLKYFGVPRNTSNKEISINTSQKSATNTPVTAISKQSTLVSSKDIDSSKPAKSREEADVRSDAQEKADIVDGSGTKDESTDTDADITTKSEITEGDVPVAASDSEHTELVDSKDCQPPTFTSSEGTKDNTTPNDCETQGPPCIDPSPPDFTRDQEHTSNSGDVSVSSTPTCTEAEGNQLQASQTKENDQTGDLEMHSMPEQLDNKTVSKETEDGDTKTVAKENLVTEDDEIRELLDHLIGMAISDMASQVGDEADTETEEQEDEDVSDDGENDVSMASEDEPKTGDDASVPHDSDSDADTESDEDDDRTKKSTSCQHRNTMATDSGDVNKEECCFEFNQQILTGGGKKPMIVCCSCKREGHSSKNCPDDRPPNLPKLPKLKPEEFKSLDQLCIDVFGIHAPTEQEIQTRDDVLKDLERFIRTNFSDDARLCLFGSSRNGFGFQQSDLDICMTYKDVDTPEDLEKPVPEIIESLAVKLKKHNGLYGVIAIPTAKVPIVKFTHRKSKLEGDISLYNTLAQHNTRMLAAYADIDRRVRQLGYTIKVFAKICDIGDASRGSLSSYAYTLMMLYFLQQRKPPVIPVLQELYKGDTKPERIVDGWNAWFMEDITKLASVWPDCGKNKESVGELWLGLLKFYTEEFDFRKNVISIRQLSPLTKFEKMWNSKCISIEDPFDLNHNLGAGVSRKMNQYIMGAFQKGRLRFGTPRKENYSTVCEYYFDTKFLTDESGPPNDRGCRICGKIGHYMKDCPQRRKRPRDKNKDGDKKDDQDGEPRDERKSDQRRISEKHRHHSGQQNYNHQQGNYQHRAQQQHMGGHHHHHQRHHHHHHQGSPQKGRQQSNQGQAQNRADDFAGLPVYQSQGYHGNRGNQQYGQQQRSSYVYNANPGQQIPQQMFFNSSTGQGQVNVSATRELSGERSGQSASQTQRQQSGPYQGQRQGNAQRGMGKNSGYHPHGPRHENRHGGRTYNDTRNQTSSSSGGGGGSGSGGYQRWSYDDTRSSSYSQSPPSSQPPVRGRGAFHQTTPQYTYSAQQGYGGNSRAQQNTNNPHYQQQQHGQQVPNMFYQTNNQSRY